MKPIVAVIAPGMMGSAVAKRLTSHGVQVPTLLAGRGADTLARAEAAGMTGATEAADRRVRHHPVDRAARRALPAWPNDSRPPCARATKKPIYVDCNAVDPATVLRIARVIEETGATFVDGGIIGRPPQPDSQKHPAVSVRNRCAQGGGAGAIRAVHAGAAGPDRRCVGHEDVLCRHHQRVHRAGRRDDARRHPRRHGRGVESRTLHQPAGAVWLADAADAEDVFQSVSLGRRDGGDRRLRRRRPGGAEFYQAARPNSTNGSPPTSTVRTRRPRCSTRSARRRTDAPWAST